MNRAEFLSSHWLSYPGLTAKPSLVGRIQSISSDGLFLKDQFIPLHAVKTFGPLRDGSHLRFELQFLREGDLVSFEEGVLNLLAPCISSFPVEEIFQNNKVIQWANFRRGIEDFFFDHKFSLVDTPYLVPSPGTEPFLDVFKTVLERGSKKQVVYLPTSPELSLKKALSMGGENIFEIKKCFRNNEVSDTHQPEFWMLEWYRAYANLETIKTDVQSLLEKLWGSKLNFRSISVSAAFDQILGVSLSPETSLEELREWIKDFCGECPNYTEWDDLFYFLFVSKIEPELKTSEPLFLEKYPPSQAALARLTSDGWGDRFELYWQGLELANAFNELNDPIIQRKRFAEDLRKKVASGREPVAIDEEFLMLLENGMPPAAGIALGLDRLFMLKYGYKTVAETRFLPVKNS